MYHVVVKSKNKKTNQFFHRIDVLSEQAGLNHYSGVYAIKELIDKKVISRESRPGHSSVYTLLKELPLYEPVENTTTHPVAQGYHITTTFKQNNLAHIGN